MAQSVAFVNQILRPAQKRRTRLPNQEVGNRVTLRLDLRVSSVRCGSNSSWLIMSESSPSLPRRIDSPRPSGSYRGQNLKIYLDEMLAPDIAKALTALGIGAKAVTRGETDEALIQRCLLDQRILVTKNHDAVYRAAKAGAKVVYLHFRKGQDGGGKDGTSSLLLGRSSRRIPWTS
jgi:Domain of unknown function (DUF5615)